MTAQRRRLKHWGWGYEDEQPPAAQLRETAQFLAGHLGFGDREPEAAVPLAEVRLPSPRLRPPPSLAPICRTDVYERALHAYGRSYRDVVRAFRGRFEHPPDLVAHPRSEAECAAVLEWALAEGAAVIPFGGGTSVVGGVEPAVPAEAFAGVVTLDLKAMDRVLEVDRVSLGARIQAGATGPVLEAQLRAHGLTLRHFPQSFAFATLGGMIATRAGGHFATLHTHIDDLVESVRALTPAGPWESRRLPGSGAGVSPDRMLIGSEGTLGVITEAWMRVRPRLDDTGFRAGTTVHFADFAAGAQAVRALAQSGLHPANCRLIDADEARLTGAGDGTRALLVLGFESPSFPVDGLLAQALECCGDHGGAWEAPDPGGRERDAAAAGWREAFLRAPYLRDVFVAMGVISETFETAVTWDRFPGLHAAVMEATAAAVRAVCGAGSVTCRLTHTYPDGPAPYYTVLAPARRGSELDQWAEIKAAAAEAILAAGGTITHHHAVGRDHRPWYDRQRPEPFAVGLRAAKRALDPGGALNPGVLVE
ncbi:MAG TPA: FAD-binding oxidoreductase [Solirubrobacteraceae bacterium]|nr:FAD-binding oxidoreductase [Solirubrobacteraceae bacterium]